MNSEYQSSKNLKSTFLAKNENTLSFPTGSTALLIIDPVNDFLSEGGAGFDLTKSTLLKNDTIQNLKLSISTARNIGIPILFAPMSFTEEDYLTEKLHQKSGINRFMFELKMFVEGSWGADFHPDLKPLANDIILQPHKSCDVFTTDLSEHLNRLGTTHLIIAGMSANLCCESTARHAMELGYDVIFLSDAIGATSIPEYEAAIHLNYPLIANTVLKTEEFVNAVTNIKESNNNVQLGDVVKGSDNGEIGIIDEINDDSDGYIRISKGMIFKENLYIPYDAVVKRIGTDVYINIPKLIISTMPWSQPPLNNQPQIQINNKS